MYVAANDIKDIAKFFHSAVSDGRMGLVLLSDKHLDDLDNIRQALAQCGKPFLGAIMPALVAENALKDDGAVIVDFDHVHGPIAVPLGDNSQDAIRNTVSAIPMLDDDAHYSVVTYLDCLAPSISSFLSELFNHYGSSVSYFGGGAGNRTLAPGNCLFDADGIYENHALLAVVRGEASIGVRHGWTRDHGPYVVTKAEGREVQELDWENPATVYRHALVGSLSNESWNNFFPEVTMRHPFCVHKDGGEDIIRDPVGLTDDGHLKFLSDVPENSVFHIVKADHKQLVAAAGEAVDSCEIQASDASPTCVISDCFSRVLLMGDAFEEEISIVTERISSRWPDAQAEGSLVLGEIAGHGEYPLEFFNKTIVVGVFNG